MKIEKNYHVGNKYVDTLILVFAILNIVLASISYYRATESKENPRAEIMRELIPLTSTVIYKDMLYYDDSSNENINEFSFITVYSFDEIEMNSTYERILMQHGWKKKQLGVYAKNNLLLTCKKMQDIHGIPDISNKVSNTFKVEVIAS